MASKEVWDHLDQQLGHEIAMLLADSKLRRTEIKNQLPYDNVHDQELHRILEDGLGPDIFEIPKTRGNKKYTLNNELFSTEEMSKIRKWARARIVDSTEETEYEAPDDVVHANVEKRQSKFLSQRS